ncbi:hypothetical protein CAPTEDRAFT_50813, partial [Capitella teleta]
IIARAYAIAMAGRPGPVVISLPEDTLAQYEDVEPFPFQEAPEPGPSDDEITKVQALLLQAQKPILLIGGSRWNSETVNALEEWAKAWQIPVATTFRRQNLFNHDHECYAGDAGIMINPRLRARIKESDLVLMIGTRLSEVASQDYSLVQMNPKQKLIHVYPGAEELGRVYIADLPILATPTTFIQSLAKLAPPSEKKWKKLAHNAHADYRYWTLIEIESADDDLNMNFVIQHMREGVARDAIVCHGAGNYGMWVQRFWNYRNFGSQLAPISGSMGYGLPAAIAAKLTCPEKEVYCFAGDGCFQMVHQELATAIQEKLHIVVLVVDNGQYGTIRMHQEMRYPGRRSATAITNPDFAAIAKASG